MEYLGLIVLLAIIAAVIGIFAMWSWRRSEDEFEQWQQRRGEDEPTDGFDDRGALRSHWGGMGRPGRH
jgi:hypothetical protein